MAENINLQVVINAKDQSKAVLSSFSSGLSGISTVATGVIAALGINGIVGAVKGTVTSMIDGAAQMEQFSIGFKTLLGNTEAADKALNRIKQDAKSTPFELPGLIQANRLLISAGLNAEAAADLILDLGDAVSATGGGQDELERLALNLQQIKNLGHATAIDLKQFAFAGIDIFGLLADSMGKTVDEVKKMDSTDITFDMISKALGTAADEGGRFFNAMRDQSTTLNGIKSNIKDTFSIMGTEILQKSGAFDLIKQSADGFLKLFVANKDKIVAFATKFVEKVIEMKNSVTDMVKDVKEWAKENPALAKSIMIGVGAVIALQVALGLLNVIAGITAVIFSPITIALLLLAATVAAVAYAWDTNFGDIQGKVKAFKDYLDTDVIPKIEDLWTALETDGVAAKDTFNNTVVPAFMEGLEIVKGGLKKSWEEDWSVYWDDVMTISVEMGKSLIVTGGILMAGYKAVTEFTLAEIKGFWEKNGKDIESIISTSWRTNVVTAKFGMDGMLGAIRVGLQIMNRDWEGAKETIKTKAARMWLELKELSILQVQILGTIIKNAVNGIIDKINGLIRGLKSTKLGNAIGGNIKEIPKLAEGGIVTKPTLAMIGEAGPEAVVPLSKASSIGAGGGISLTIYGDVYGIDDLAGKLSDALKRVAKSKGMSTSEFLDFNGFA